MDKTILEFNVLTKIIHDRRTIKPCRMNGKVIPKTDIELLLELANWAPTHGYTEPWRFIVFEGEALHAFSHRHAELYKKFTPPDRFKDYKYEKLITRGEKSSHLIAVIMHRTTDSKIPEQEEYAAVATAVQNILLGASALGIAAMWSTGGMATTPAMKRVLDLPAEDRVVSFLYLGYSDQSPNEGRRKIPLSDKVIWKHDKF